MHEASLPCPGWPTELAQRNGVARSGWLGQVFVGFFGVISGGSNGKCPLKKQVHPQKFGKCFRDFPKKTGTPLGNLTANAPKNTQSPKETIHGPYIVSQSSMFRFPNWPTLTSLNQVTNSWPRVTLKQTTHNSPLKPKNAIAKTGNDQFPISDCINSCNAVPVL